jgi:hypothetical protein
MLTNFRFITDLDGPSTLCRAALPYYRFIILNNLYVIVFTWVLLNVSPLPIDVVLTYSPCCKFTNMLHKNKKPQRTKKPKLLTSHNHGYKVKVTIKIATNALLTHFTTLQICVWQFILDTQIFVAQYIHSLVNKLQHIYWF